MKKLILIAVAVVAVFGLVGFAVFEVVQAQAPEPAGTPQPGYGPFGRGERGFGMPGMQRMGRGMGMLEQGWMHDEMIAVFAEKFGMTAADLEARLEQGDTLWQVAEEKGMSADEFFSLRQQVRGDLIDQAVKDGKITQEQADWMKTRMGNRAQRMEQCFPRMFGGDAQATPAP